MINKKSIITILIAIVVICVSFTTVKAEDTTNNVNNTDNEEETTSSVQNQEQNEITIQYNYNEDKNTVTVVAISNIGFNNTKPSWTLSKDKKTYTKTFESNQNYTTPFTQSNGKVSNMNINITQVKDMQLTITYEYNSTQNIVTATVISNVPMKNTKPTWNLSSDKKTYTKKFDSNQNYTTPFTAGNGKVVNFGINITQIKDMELTIEYKYDSTQNTVTAIVTSNVPMKNTKPTWSLSKDKKTYTKTFNSNQKYSTPFTQSNGKIVNLGIEIVDIKPMELTAKYEYNEAKTLAKVTVTSNFQMKDTKSTWTLSSDKKTYTKVFESNTNYSTDFTQISGASTKLNIKVNQIKELKLTTKYDYDANRRQVKVTVSSNFAMQNNKPTWALSSDKKTYTKTYTDNMVYSTPFTDEYGRVINVIIRIENIDKTPILLSNVTLKSPGSSADRNTNLRIASNTINGKVLKPGETFIWSQVVGPATYAKGYKNAAVFQGNKVVQGIGGGICQVSSTLYQAVRNIGLNIIERHTHSLPVSYTTLGNDATVSYGSLDFIFQNNKPYSIKIEMSAGYGTVNCKIYGI